MNEFNYSRLFLNSRCEGRNGEIHKLTKKKLEEIKPIEEEIKGIKDAWNEMFPWAVIDKNKAYEYDREEEIDYYRGVECSVIRHAESVHHAFTLCSELKAKSKPDKRGNKTGYGIRFKEQKGNAIRLPGGLAVFVTKGLFKDSIYDICEDTYISQEYGFYDKTLNYHKDRVLALKTKRYSSYLMYLSQMGVTPELFLKYNDDGMTLEETMKLELGEDFF